MVCLFHHKEDRHQLFFYILLLSHYLPSVVPFVRATVVESTSITMLHSLGDRMRRSLGRPPLTRSNDGFDDDTHPARVVDHPKASQDTIPTTGILGPSKPISQQAAPPV